MFHNGVAQNPGGAKFQESGSGHPVDKESLSPAAQRELELEEFCNITDNPAPLRVIARVDCLRDCLRLQTRTSRRRWTSGSRWSACPSFLSRFSRFFLTFVSQFLSFFFSGLPADQQPEHEPRREPGRERKNDEQQ